MKNFIIPLFILSVTFFSSCRNVYEKEHQQILDLQITIDNTEEVLFSVDTAETFTIVREIKQELRSFGKKYDSLGKEAAFKVADYYGNKKSLYFLFDNYNKFIHELKISREQLVALKQDLDNNLISQEQFLEYYKNEEQIILALNDKISHAINSSVMSIDSIKKNKIEVHELLASYENKEK